MASVFYKLRDTFVFNVGAGLTIRNVIFDATDSSIKNYGDDLNCTNANDKLCCQLMFTLGYYMGSSIGFPTPNCY